MNAPASGAYLRGGVTLAANASDDTAVAAVQFRVDDLNLGTEDTAPPFTLSWDTLKIADGTHALTAVARDAAGNSAVSAPVPVTVVNAIFETFEDGDAAGWVSDGLGSWAVATQNGNWVFRQSNNTVVANRAYLEASNWGDQLVEADVMLNSASGNNRFFGVVARYRSATDYYYFVLRTNNTAELKRLANGVAANVVAPRVLPFTVTPGVTYRLTLEVVGSWLRAYVNGQLLMEGSDTTFASGRAGLLTFFSDVSVDNVHADPSPNAPVLP